MSTSYSDSISQIYGIHNEAKRWTSGAINIIVATSKANDLPLKINLTETLGHGKKVPRANKRGDHNCYWLPSSINENNEAFRRKHIHPLFTTACWNAGFIIHAEYDANDTCIVFKCFHSKHHNEEKQSQYRNNRERQVRNPDIPPLPRTWRKSARPVFGEEGHILCSFKLRLYYDELSKRWFLPKQQSGNPNHCGHIWEPPEHLRIQCHLAPKEEVQISSDAMNAHVPISATGSLFHERTGMTLEAHQLRYLQKQNLKTDDLLMDAGTGPPVTAMDKLLAELRSDPACHFICLYGEFNSNLLTIKTRKRASTNNAESIEEFTTNLEDTSDSPRKFAEDYRNSRSSLKDTSNGKIVLAIAWTNDEARRKMDMFPEFLGGDDTEETNSEDRPFYTMCGKDSYNKSFGHTWCFMPSKCQWVYEWMFGTALPVLHPGTSLSRVQIVVTDDDKQETRAANNNCGRGVDLHRSLPNARHRHCAWHKINRNFTENAKYKSKLSTVKKRSYKSAIEVDTIIKWLWYFIKYYESTEEVNFAYQLLDLYLTEDQTSHFGDIDDNVRQDIKEFITKNFHLHRTTLYESEYPSIMTLGNCTTSVNEAEHRVYKHHCLGPRPCDNVATAAKKINKLNKMREGTKTRQVAHDMRSSLGTSDAREMVDERLTDRCNKTLLSEHEAANKHYSLYRPSQFQFYVKRNYFASPSTAEDDLHLTEQQRAALFDKIDPNDLCLPPSKKKRRKQRNSDSTSNKDVEDAIESYKHMLKDQMKLIIPRFQRTRTVSVVEGQKPGEKIIICDCPFFARYGLACRHIYKVICRHPRVEDALPRWLIAFIHYYGRNEEISRQFLRLCKSSDKRGVTVSAADWATISEEYAVGDASKMPLEYFSCSLGKLRLCEPNYWQQIGDRVVAKCRCDMSVLGSAKPTSTGETTSLTSGVLAMSKSKNNVAVAPVGLEQVVECSSKFKVPSQLSDSEEVDDDVVFDSTHNDDAMIGDDDSDDGIVKGASGNLYCDYLPMYTSITKLCKGLGNEGEEILQKGFRRIRQQLLSAHEHGDKRTASEMPHVLQKKVKATRLSKPGSPNKSRDK